MLEIEGQNEVGAAPFCSHDDIQFVREFLITILPNEPGFSKDVTCCRYCCYEVTFKSGESYLFPLWAPVLGQAVLGENPTVARKATLNP